MSTSLCLERIERYAAHVINDARSASAAVKALPARPGFKTNAEEALRNAQSELTESLELLGEALAEYSEKPITA